MSTPLANTLPAPTEPADLAAQWTAAARWAGWAGAASIVVAVAAMLAWAVWAPLGGAIVAMGLVKVDTNRKTVQHRDGGIVREILVREGERVKAGQTLVVLDDARIDSTLDQTSSQLDAFRIRQSRLDAERAMAPAWKLPETWRKRIGEPRLAEIVAREQALFTTRRAALDSQLRQLRDQIEEVKREIAARELEGTSVRSALAQMQEEVRLNEALAEQQFVNKTRVMALQRAASEYQMKQGENAAELSRAKRSATDLELRMSSLRDAYVQEATTELRDVNGKLIDLEEQLRSARDASTRKLITAPVAGRVVDLKLTTPGGTLGPRDPVLDIVPDDSPLIVDARVGVDAIGELRVGLPTDVRLTTYRQRNTPLIEGKVVYVSADSLVDRQTGAPYFVVHVELDRASLEHAGNPAVLPGMGAEVFVRTRERSAIDYLVEPLTNAMRRSMREY
ncbi:HlyD family type I secretion periplasmic adaptor subunit [Piscinibacter defluvii]|uniref:HlyD family type I secretion periplasmic adaptor subunit n=1 Tax=Piscinibacter defluvii TaxID=1796922 RepID=UPI000FDE2461|nr:HlyD family type I secretion periplasmic adaptor subunit [Piscinibacter defluvii]